MPSDFATKRVRGEVADVQFLVDSVNSNTGSIAGGYAARIIVAPDNIDNGGLTKKLINCACCCERVNVAMIVPMPMPERTQSMPAT